MEGEISGTGGPGPGTARAAEAENPLGLGRLMSLSDGVVAIAITLLVLQLRLPSVAQLSNPDSAGQLAGQLGRSSGELISYAISFYVIAQFWFAHHRTFKYIVADSPGIIVCNFFFLFTITIMPFTSDLLGRFPNNPLGVDIFAGNLLLISFSTRAVYLYARRRGLTRTAPAAEMAGARRRIAALAIAAVISMVVAWVDASVAPYCWLLILVLPGLLGRLGARPPAPARA